jgi:hypothetical protein
MIWAAQALGYKIGQLTLFGLREREEGLGDRFDIRGFHDSIRAWGPADGRPERPHRRMDHGDEGERRTRLNRPGPLSLRFAKVQPTRTTLAIPSGERRIP